MGLRKFNMVSSLLLTARKISAYRVTEIIANAAGTGGRLLSQANKNPVGKSMEGNGEESSRLENCAEDGVKRHCYTILDGTRLTFR